MPRPYPDSAKHENFCGGWDFQKAQRPRLYAQNELAIEDFKKNFPAVLEAIRAALPSQLYISRCRYYLDKPPAEDWDGVWILDKK